MTEPQQTRQVDRIEQPSLVDLAVGKIRELMLAGAIRPGESVREEWLTEKLGISRPPIREAMQVLVQQGLLERLPRRGVRAVTFTEADVWEIYSLRSALDRFALSLAMPVEDAGKLEALREAMTGMKSAAASGDHASYVEANRRFHVALVALGNNGRLTGAYETLMNQMQLLMSVNLSQEESAADRAVGVRRHEDLLAAIESGDLGKALAALDVHGERRFLSESPARTRGR
jgi:DNA-binding GntR family transcriptional regulator